MPKSRIGKVFWIFGNSGAGKTTLARQLQPILNAILLDGNELREVWALGLSRADREEQNRRAAKLAHLLSHQGHNVIVATICPYNTLRREVSEICGPTWLYLPGGKPANDEYPFEVPEIPHIALQKFPDPKQVAKTVAAQASLQPH